MQFVILKFPYFCLVDAARISGEFQENADFEKGNSVSASDDEIVGLTDEKIEYKDVTSKLVKLVSIESEEFFEDDSENQQGIKEKQETVAKEEDISRIAETLSNRMETENEAKILPPPGRPVVVIVNEKGAEESLEKVERPQDMQRQTSTSSLSDSGRFSTSKKDGRASSNHSSDEELEWDEEYEFGNKLRNSKSGRKVDPREELDQVTKNVEGFSLKGDNKKSKRASNRGVEKAEVVAKELSNRQNIAGKTRAPKTAKVAAPKEARKVRPRSEIQTVKEVEKAPARSVQSKDVPKKSPSGKTKRSVKRTRYKIYLDDPDIHQTIADFSGLLRRLKDEVEKGEFVPKPGNRLHPQSRDDVTEGLYSL